MEKDNIEIIFKLLKEKAKEKNNAEALNKLNDSLFQNINSLISIANDLDFNLNIILEDDFEKSLYSKIAFTLSNDYFTIYYVNLSTNEFIEYNSNKDYQTLKLEKSGKDFFGEITKTAPRAVYHEDLKMVLEGLKKENLMKSIENENSFVLQYRLMINDKPIYVLLKATTLQDDKNHLIIGVSNIDSYKKMEINYRKAMGEMLSNSSLSLTSQDYLTIMNINLETNEYVVYKSSEEYDKFEFAKQGKNFFEDAKENILKSIYEPDRKYVTESLEKNNFIKRIKKGTYYFRYRLMLNNKPVYVQTKALLLPEDNSHAILGISNVDYDMKKQQEYQNMLAKEKDLARRDGMTGALNKFAYLEKETEINKLIAKNNNNLNFAAIIFDINGLKQVNDTYGHIAGDDYIKAAYDMINNIFIKSPVFRIGGDEFVVIIENEEFENYKSLVKVFNELNEKNINNGDVNLAFGYTDFNSKNDLYLSDVIDRADKIMYANKTILKARLNSNL